MRTTITALLLILTFSTPSQAAKYYKWVDQDGVTHYTAQPPHNKPAETLNIRTGESRSAEKTKTETDAESPSTTKDAPSESPESAPKPETVQKAKSTKDPERCDQARSIRETLVNNNRVRVKDELTGEYTYKTQEELEQWREENAEDIRNYCR